MRPALLSVQFGTGQMGNGGGSVFLDEERDALLAVSSWLSLRSLESVRRDLPSFIFVLGFDGRGLEGSGGVVP